jgi:hypothetical protein
VLWRCQASRARSSRSSGHELPSLLPRTGKVVQQRRARSPCLTCLGGGARQYPSPHVFQHSHRPHVTVAFAMFWMARGAERQASWVVDGVRTRNGMAVYIRRGFFFSHTCQCKMANEGCAGLVKDRSLDQRRRSAYLLWLLPNLLLEWRIRKMRRKSSTSAGGDTLPYITFALDISHLSIHNYISDRPESQPSSYHHKAYPHYRIPLPSISWCWYSYPLYLPS